MAHYAQLDSDNVVVNVFVGRDENDLAEGVTDWETYYATPGFTVKRTSYNTYGSVHYTDGVKSADQRKAFRFNGSGIGYTYDPERDAFIAPQPYNKWILNESTCRWEAPVPYPSDGLDYVWNDNKGVWEFVVVEAIRLEEETQ
jgi:hypothetical protein